MTSEEAKKVATIALTADGGCSVCAEALFQQLVMAFPGHDWDAWFREEQGFGLDEED